MTPNKKKNDIRFDLLQFWTKQAYYQGISLPSNMCLPSKRFTDPSGFCGAETNVTTNKSKGKGLGFGVLGFFFSVGFFFIPSLFFCPEMTKSLPNLEHNCLWQ